MTNQDEIDAVPHRPDLASDLTGSSAANTAVSSAISGAATGALIGAAMGGFLPLGTIIFASVGAMAGAILSRKLKKDETK